MMIVEKAHGLPGAVSCFHQLLKHLQCPLGHLTLGHALVQILVQVPPEHWGQ